MNSFATLKNIAVIGLSPDPSKPSHQVALYLQKKGYEITPIYPRAELILGKRALQEIAQLQGLAIDWLLVFRKSELCVQITQEALKIPSLRGIWLQLGIRNDTAQELALNGGLDFVQDRCIKLELQKEDLHVCNEG